MIFNTKFFLVVLTLSAALATIHHSVEWTLIFDGAMSIHWLFVSVAMGPIGLVVGVILPFAVMYTLSKRIASQSEFGPIIASTFLGSWLGKVSLEIVSFVITSGRLDYQYDWIPIYQLVWPIFALALSSFFFICLAAILFAYYQKTRKNGRSPQPRIRETS